MKTTLAAFFLAAMSSHWTSTGCVIAQTHQREMLYSQRIAIADRLLPNDKDVLVYKSRGEIYMPAPVTKTYEEEIQGLKLDDIIALVRVRTVQSELIERGTWVQTKLSAQVEQLIQNRRKEPLSDALEFTISGGAIQIGRVAVTAGAFPRFVTGEQYLLVFVSRPQRSLVYALHVNNEGVLEPLKSNDGTALSSRTSLAGKSVLPVLEALRGQ